MFVQGDRVVYGIHGVCSVVDLQTRRVDKKDIEYYVLEPVDQPGTRYFVPTQNKAAAAKLQPILTREALDELLHSEDVDKNAWIEDEGRRKQYYRELINSGDRTALVCMVRTLHKQKKTQLSAGRKFHLCDENFLRDAQKLLSSEFALVLGIQAGEVEDYVIQAINAD